MEKNSLIKSNPLIIERIVNLGGIDRKVYVKFFDYPYPHAIIDDFFDKKSFKNISLSLAGKDNEPTYKNDFLKGFNTNLEAGKKVFAVKGLKEFQRLPIEVLGGQTGLELICELIGIENITSMASRPEFGGYYPLHEMIPGGLLGAHVDHSNSKIDQCVHVANSIYYVHPLWKDCWGGQTVLYDSLGIRPLKLVSPRPNRLVLFRHDLHSFHGVRRISKSIESNRISFYMDYYAKSSSLAEVSRWFSNGKRSARYCMHTTTFVPFFSDGLNSFRFNKLKPKRDLKYLKLYIQYLLSRFFSKIGLYFRS